tara:strand:- start:751 stop:1947 length:1197 start_codon:yes stop_codon:yes gene_type:complete
MNRLDTRLKNFRKNSFKTQKSIFLFGLFFAFAITLKEVTNLSYNNFQIFYFGSTDFWNDINPYSNWLHLSKRNVPLDIFLYLPVFSILFTPFTFLPMWLGAFFWNFFTYSLFYFSIFQLPEKFLFKDKKFIFFISCLLLFATMLSMQFNPVIAAIFLLAFSYFEKDKPYIALLLILLSGFTKVYGIFQLSMLIFYPKFWKNVGFTLIIGILLFFLPLVHLDFSELLPYYQSWVETIAGHSRLQDFYSVYRAIYTFFPEINKSASIISLMVLLMLFFAGLAYIKKIKKSFSLRAQYLGILMGYTILFGLGSELHTYVIAMVGYAIWYLYSEKSKFNTVLLWINFFLLVIFPIDIFCPVVISKFVLGKLNLGVLVFFITWISMVYKTFSSQKVDYTEPKA